MRGSRSANTASATGAPGMRFAVMRSPSMQEVPLSGEDHREAELVGARDVRIVAHRAAGLDDDGDARARGGPDAVGERVERVACARAVLGPTIGLLGRDLARFDPVLLTGADPDRLPVLDEDDRVRLHVSADPPRELGVAPLLLGRRGARDHAPVVAGRGEVVRLLDEEAARELTEVETLPRRRGCGEDARKSVV